MNILRALIDGLGFSVFMAVSSLLIVKYNPRFMLKSCPKSVVQQVAPQTTEEKRQFKRIAIPLQAAVMLALLASILQCYWGTPVGYLTVALHLLVVSMVWTVVDFLLDILLFCIAMPRFMVIPGTDRHSYKDYGQQLRGFLIGCGVSLAASAVLGAALFGLLQLARFAV